MSFNRGSAALVAIKFAGNMEIAFCEITVLQSDKTFEPILQ